MHPCLRQALADHLQCTQSPAVSEGTRGTEQVSREAWGPQGAEALALMTAGVQELGSWEDDKSGVYAAGRVV